MVKTQRRRQRKSRKSRIRKTMRRKRGGSTMNVEITKYYMDGCPACEKSKDAWEAFKKTTKAETKEIESANIPESANIEAFPTYVVRKNGKETKRHTGAIMSAGEVNQLLQG